MFMCCSYLFIILLLLFIFVIMLLRCYNVFNMCVLMCVLFVIFVLYLLFIISLLFLFMLCHCILYFICYTCNNHPFLYVVYYLLLFVSYVYFHCYSGSYVFII